MIDYTNIKDWFKYLWIFLSIMLLFIACAPKNYPVGRAYVYENKIQFKANLPAEERKNIETNLYNYLDDSLKVVTKRIVGFKRIINPSVFDSLNIERSKTFMKAYLNSLGYYYATFDTIKIRIDTISKKDIRVFLQFVINANKQIKFDSVWYNFKDSVLQSLAQENREKTLLKKGKGYSQPLVLQEFDRLIALFRSKGYYKISRNDLQAEGDTVNKALISTINDPFAQIEMARKWKENPTIDLRIYEQPHSDSFNFFPYKIGKVFIYPEGNGKGFAFAKKDSSYKIYIRKNVYIKSKNGRFRDRVVYRLNSIRPGTIYNEQSYFKTINQYTRAGSWQQVDVLDSIYNGDSIKHVDISLFLTPAKKFSFKTDLEASQNVGRGTIEALTGSFFGISLSGDLLDRNFARSAIQWNSNVRAGLEVNSQGTSIQKDLFQTIQASAGTTFSIPRLWPPFNKWIKRADAGRTFLNISGSYTRRKDFYELKNANTSFGYEWKKKNNVWTLNLLNIEFVNVDKTDSLNKVLENNKVLKYAFNQGLVMSLAASLQKNIFYKNRPNQSSYLRVTAEESGGLLGSIIFKNNLLRFAKIDAEFRHYITFPRHKYAFRFIGGYGRSFDDSTTLPFFRQFIVGGPNSMRAWRLRQLGLGNSLTQDTSSSNYKDRLGDIYLEANAEYRFNMFRLFGYLMEGALFTDIGNIWNRKLRTNPTNDGVFSFKNVYSDLAVDAGFGIRWDFSYLRVRLDFAYKLKDPVREGNGWLRRFEWKSADRSGKIENPNMALQFGIDYPF